MFLLRRLFSRLLSHYLEVHTVAVTSVRLCISRESQNRSITCTCSVVSVGVDSMVISKILVLLKDNAPRLRIKQVLAVHIDYGNRPESVREAEYLATQWCADNGA